MSEKVWILKVKGTQASFGGNLGYPDQPSSLYVYDTTVKNHEKLAEGDLVILANKTDIIGYAVITRIDIKASVSKIRLRCPHCNTQEHYMRKNILPRNQCRNKHAFDIPTPEPIVVDEYTAHYASSFVRPDSRTSVKVLEPFYLRRNLYYSIQQASFDFFNEDRNNLLVQLRSTRRTLLKTEPYFPSYTDDRDHTVALKALRKGQEKFKSILSEIYGFKCMITGCEVAAAIEASHICPYRGEKDNHPCNGLLLRTDLHKLFDANLIGIEPSTLRIELHSSISGSYYRGINGLKLAIVRKDILPSIEALEYRWQLFKRSG